MADIVFVGVVVAFFALAVLVVKACDRIIGPETATALAEPEPAEMERPAA